MSDLCPGSGTQPAAAVDREKTFRRGKVMIAIPVSSPVLISLAALARMTETEIAETAAAIHQSYTTELQGTQA